MTLGLELAAAFLGGAVTAFAAAGLVIRRELKRLGLLALLGGIGSAGFARKPAGKL